MYIIDYGFMAKASNNKNLITPLCQGVPKPAAFLDHVDLFYQGSLFARLQENPNHVSCKFIGKHWKTVKNTKKMAYSHLYGSGITIEKNRIYQENGRDSSILSNILYSLTLNPEIDIGDQVKILPALRKLIDEHFYYMFAKERTEEEV